VFSGTVIWVNSLDGIPLLRDLGRSLPRLIYATTGAAGLGTSLCSRTTDLASAAVDLAYLGTLPQLTLTPALPWPLYLCLASAVGALAFAIWAVRRKAKLRARRTAS
jgi:hypothetical protein